MNIRDHRLLILDGACGTNLQAMDIPASVRDGNDGCNEYLNVSWPSGIQALHASFIEAGAMVLETNTFGASRIVLAEYGLEDRVREINAAAVAHARAAIDERAGRYVAGSVGPGTKLPSLGHIEVDALAAALHEQIDALVEAGVDAGLDAAIVDAGKIVPYASVSEEDRTICSNLLYDRATESGETPLTEFIEYFTSRDDDTPNEEAETGNVLPQRVLFDMVVSGKKDGLEDQLAILLRRITALGIVNQILVPAMRHVGELFGRGDILLPFVLKAAEVMKQAVGYLEPHMETIENESVTTVLLATVQGDVHDIGKNLVDNEVTPIYDDLKRRSVEDGLVTPKVAYGYYRCQSEGDRLLVADGDREHAFAFPRQGEPPHLCISDYFKTADEGGDIVSFFVVTIGERIDKETHALYDRDAYHEYLMMHGFSVEVTDALAEYWHDVMRREWGFVEDRPDSTTGYATQDYRGSRYGFGYPACPDLGAHRPVFAMLKPEHIGVTLTESLEMVPEQTTSAIVAHHPQAKYFAV